MFTYPDRAADRDRWIVEQRPARNAVDPYTPYAFLVEQERASSGDIASIATIFLTNRECPWRCLMCDLWRNTLTESVPAGAITAQVAYALERLPATSQVKLYNSGSFFDPRAIPVADHESIIALCSPFERVIVECHPALLNERALRFRDLLSGKLEVAMGLETVHPEGLAKLNKRMTLEQFRIGADFLRVNDIDLRVFVLVQPAFVPASEALYWAKRSIDLAFDCGATAVTVIPTRAGNGAMEALQASGSFVPPTLLTIEAALEYGINADRGRVFVDLWDIDKVEACQACRMFRTKRLTTMNLSQTVPPETNCTLCGVAA